MEDYLRFLENSKCIIDKKIKSIKIYMKLIDDTSMPNEMLVCKVLFNSNGTPKQLTTHDKDGNIHEKSIYNLSGQLILKTIDHYNTADRQMPKIDTISFEYKNNLLVRETEVSESNFMGMYEKGTMYIREYQYDLQNRLIKRIETYLPDSEKRITTIEYPTSEITKEVEYDNDGQINTATFFKYNSQGLIVEKRTLNSYQYEDNSDTNQMFKQNYFYDGEKVNKIQYLKEVGGKTESSLIFHYNDKEYLNKADFYENDVHEYVLRYEYKLIGFFNRLFK